MPGWGWWSAKRLAKRANRRNYMKRVIRDTFRQHPDRVAGVDFVVRVRAPFDRAGRPEACRSLAGPVCQAVVMSRIVLALIRFYQLAISPWLPPRCRYQPTCSRA